MQSEVMEAEQMKVDRTVIARMAKERCSVSKLETVGLSSEYWDKFPEMSLLIKLEVYLTLLQKLCVKKVANCTFACLLTQMVLTFNLFSWTTLLMWHKVCLWYEFHWCLTVGNMFTIYNIPELYYLWFQQCMVTRNVFTFQWLTSPIGIMWL